MLKAEVKERWLKALKSGEYKKTTGHLKDDEGFCCLGVLYDIELKPNWKKGVNLQPPGMEDENSRLINPELSERTGLSFKNAIYLASLNDYSGSDNFERVIEKIEKEL